MIHRPNPISSSEANLEDDSHPANALRGRQPIPLPSYLDDCDYLGFVHGARRWRSKNGKQLFTWDSPHGEIEVFDLLGRHVAVLNADGEWRKGPVSGRRINV